jgi:hypothetical protein
MKKLLLLGAVVFGTALFGAADKAEAGHYSYGRSYGHHYSRSYTHFGPGGHHSYHRGYGHGRSYGYSRHYTPRSYGHSYGSHYGRHGYHGGGIHFGSRRFSIGLHF